MNKENMVEVSVHVSSRKRPREFDSVEGYDFALRESKRANLGSSFSLLG